MTTYCCDCKWSRDGGDQGNTEEMMCDHEKLSKSYVTGKKGARKCSEVNWDGNCFGYQWAGETRETGEIISETEFFSDKPADS